MIRSLTYPLVAAVTALALATGPASAQKAPERPATAAAASSNATDIVFVRQMTPHHTGGVTLGKLAVSRGSDSRIRSLGKGIVAAQSRELVTLKASLKRFNATELTFAPVEARNTADMKLLRGLSADAFDRAWLDVISSHHMAAIQMAAMERAGGGNAALRSLASRIIREQSAELSRFNTLAAAKNR